MKNKKNGEKRKRVYPVIQFISLALLSAAAFALSAMLFIVVSSAHIFTLLKVLCTAVACLTPAFIAKTYICIRKLKDKKVCSMLTLLGFALSLIFSLCFYVSHDYSMSVYRFMKQTSADVYYFAGYDSFKKDYADAADFEKQMKAAPASIVLENMSEEKLSQLSANELKQINSSSLWDYCGFDDILGKTTAEIESSMTAAKDMNAYEFTFGYRGLHAKTFGYLIAHPNLVLSETAAMIKQRSVYSVSFSTLITFFIAQLLAAWMAVTHFEITSDKGLIFVSKPFSLPRKKGQ